MADPEQMYQEVLSEEQGKGVSPAVAEARAKAARVRAEHGSPHPKEPKWWAGAQPHLEGGDEGAEAPAAEASAEEAPAAEAPAEEAPAAEAPAQEATAEVQTDEVAPDAPAAQPEPATEEPVAPAAAGTTAPAPQTVPQEPAAVAPQPAAAAAATQTVIPKTTGVSHGTTTGTRLRPEDEVATDAQFEGQKAMYERRKLIDDLVATGVPQVTAYETDRPRSPWLAVLYLLIPLVAIFIIASNDDGTEGEASADTEATAPAGGGGGEGGGGEGGGGGSGTTLVAANIEWDRETLTFQANEETTVTVENQDSTVHNMSIYPDEEAAKSQSDPIFQGEDIEGGASVDYTIDPLDKGTYTFICDYHINMIGEVQVE